MPKKPHVGYKKHKKVEISKRQKRRYLSDLITYKPGGSRVSLMERVVKLLIYFALRLVIRPRRWKDPEKNYEIIDRTYKRIMSSDFIFIPSSVAFYIIMAFMPVLTIIAFLVSLPGLEDFKTEIDQVLGSFIPGMKDVLEQASKMFDHASSSHWVDMALGTSATVVSLIIVTWIASGGFAKLIYTQSYIYEHKFVGGYWMNRIKGMFMVLGLTIYLLAALLINVFVNRWLRTLYGVSLSDSGDNIGFVVTKNIFLVIALLILIFGGMILLYRFSPRYKIKTRHVVPGAMVTALPTTFFMSLFGIISSYWSYGAYGAIGVIMYIGMASLIVSNFIFMGLISNAAYYKTFVGNAVDKKWTVSKK